MLHRKILRPPPAMNHLHRQGVFLYWLRTVALLIGLFFACIAPGCGASDEFLPEDQEEQEDVGEVVEALTGVTNIALKKPTTLSSTASGGSASRAVDGNTNGDWYAGSVAHSDLEINPWLQVDLQASSAIDTVVLWPRTDCCTDRLSNFRLRISDDGANWQDFFFPGIATPQATIAINSSARYVRVQLEGSSPRYLNIADMQIFGVASLAQGKPATLSTTAADGFASRAVDGNTDGHWSAGSIAHSDLQLNPWLQVDLQASAVIDTVVLWPRTDCCTDRLSNFRLRVSDDGTNWQDFSYPGVATPQATIAVNRSARYVRVELVGVSPRYLNIAEMQVFGLPNLARGKTATQSSTAWGAVAARAVDGNTDGNYNAGSVALSDFELNPWLQVDLQSRLFIGNVILWPRTDCCSDTLNNFRLRVSDDGTNWRDIAHPGGSTPQATIAVNRSARYVRVQLEGNTPRSLNIAEMQVFPVAGWFRVHNSDDECMDVPSDDVAEDVIPNDCHYGYNQQVRFEPTGDGWFRIKFRHTGYYLTVPQNSNSDAKRLWHYPETNSVDQLFSFENLSDGSFRIWTKNNKALAYLPLIDENYVVYQVVNDYLAQYDGVRYDSFGIEEGTYRSSLMWVDVIDTPWPNVATLLTDWGYSDRRWMVDFNGDGKADYCRAVGNSSGGGSYLRCALATTGGFGLPSEDLSSAVDDWGYSDRRWMVDFNGDDKADYCRAVGNSSGAGSYLRCSASNGAALAASAADPWSPITDWGYGDRRWMVDFNGDGKADFCRAVGNSSGAGSYLRCAISSGSGFGNGGADIWTAVEDWGYGDRRWMVDFNGDGKTDFCRAAGNSSGDGSYLRCSFSNGAELNAPGGDVWIPIVDWGYSDRKWMADVNGDGQADFCRATGETSGGGSLLRCSLSNGAGFAATDLVVPMPDWGSDDRWFMADVDGDGGADFGRTSSANASLLIFDQL